MRFLALTALAALLLGLTACGEDDPTLSPTEGQNSAETTEDDSERSEGSADDDESADDGSGGSTQGSDDEDGHDHDGSGSTGTSGSTESAGSGRDQTAGAGLVGKPRTKEVRSDDFPGGGGAERARLVDVRVGAHDGFDRIVLEFRGQDIPSYRVGYLDPPVRQDGSGNKVDVAGNAFLELRTTPASGRTAHGKTTYEGPRRVPGGSASVVTEVVRTGDFEANLAWVAGVDRRRPFAVAFLKDPLRLVVDVVAE